MRTLRLFWTLVRWDVVRELRRREIVINMTLFAVLILFLVQVGLGQKQDIAASVGPIVFWVTILFAGTVGLSQAFVVEREEGRLIGLQLAPVDLGVLYFAKVFATWLYLLVMAVAMLGAYVLFFNFNKWELLPGIVATIAVFTFGYIAAGVVLSAMTTALRGGGDIVLRVLLLPLMIPVLILTLKVSETIFGAEIAGGAALGEPMPLLNYVLSVGAIDVIYATTGFLFFPKVLED